MKIRREQTFSGRKIDAHVGLAACLQSGTPIMSLRAEPHVPFTHVHLNQWQAEGSVPITKRGFRTKPDIQSIQNALQQRLKSRSPLELPIHNPCGGGGDTETGKKSCLFPLSAAPAPPPGEAHEEQLLPETG